MISTAFIAATLLSQTPKSQESPLRVSGRYESLLRSVESGKSVRIFVDYSLTKLVVEGKDEPAPKAKGGFMIGNWEWFDVGVVRNKLAYIAASETSIVVHPSYGAVHNYVKFRFYSDGTVTINARYLKPGDLTTVMDETFTATLEGNKPPVSFRVF